MCEVALELTIVVGLWKGDFGLIWKVLLGRCHFISTQASVFICWPIEFIQFAALL